MKFREERLSSVRRLVVITLCVAAGAISVPAGAQRGSETGGVSPDVQDVREQGRHFDARVAETALADLRPNTAQQRSIAELRAAIPELDVTFDDTTGVTRSLWNRLGYLSEPDSRSPLDIARGYITESQASLGLVAGDVADLELTDSVYSSVTGATHLYFRQRAGGLSVYNTQLHVNVNRAGRIISVNNSFLPGIASVSGDALQPTVSAVAAVTYAAAHLKRGAGDVRPTLVDTAAPQRTTDIQADELSTEPIKARLMLLPIARGEGRLVWNFAVHTTDNEHAYDFTIDAQTGQVWTRFDWVSSDQYKVYARPAESPQHVSPAAPADGRVTVAGPHHATPSPFGWHDTNGVSGAEFTKMRGNNAHAYDDSATANAPPAIEPDCGGTIDCTFPIDLTQAPSTYRPAAVANLFYWSNLVHDVQYLYGFDEAGGNFQVNNYGRGGAGNDDVRAEAQDGGGINNANFLTPPDGSRPRMQMYLWNSTTPSRDGDFDNGIVVHEYGHGISTRQVGGPSNSSCLTNAQQPGEGISDWLALVYTHKSGDTGATRRPVGTYAMGQATTGNGIRGVPYTTDTSINNWTYASIAGRTVPHGVGAVWAQGMWRVYWALVDQHGFSTDLYAPLGGFGNQRAMLYHNEGLKNTACNPTFTQLRDGIIQAAVDNYGGQDVCRIWTAFAAFGLGSDAISRGSGSTTPVNGFNKPVSCGGVAPPSVSINDATVNEGNSGPTSASLIASLSSTYPWDVRMRYTTTDGTATSATTHTLAGSVTIPSVGQASSYPAQVVVSGLSGTIQHLRVSLNSMSHTWPADVDVVLVGPAGQNVMLMSDAGAGVDMSNANLTFQDGAPPMTAGPLITGTYAPTNLGGTSPDPMPAPSPASPFGDALSVFDGTDPNGTWRLFVVDDEAGDAGSFGGFSVLITTTSEDYLPKTGEIVFPAGTTTRPITTTIFGDTGVEPNETFSITLSDPGAGVSLLDSLGVLTIADDDGAPPAAAVLTSPLGGVGTLTPTYTWQAVPASTWYYLWVNDATGNVIKEWYTAAQAGCAGSSTCSITPSVTLAQGSATWWIRTWNAIDNGPWSAIGNFSTGPPEATTLIAPAGLAASTTPAYRWNAVPAASWYYVWANDSTGNVIKTWFTAEQAGCAAGVGTCEVTPAVALALGDGQFWVQTWNALGYGPWSATLQFTVPAFSVTQTWPVTGGAPGATVKLWAYVVNNTGSAIPAGTNVWFRVTMPDGTTTWVGFEPVTGLAPGTGMWYGYDWLIPGGALRGAYQYEAQVWDGSGARSGFTPPRSFTVGS